MNSLQYYLAKCQQSKIRDDEIEYDLLQITYFVAVSEVRQPGPQEREDCALDKKTELL